MRKLRHKGICDMLKVKLLVSGRVITDCDSVHWATIPRATLPVLTLSRRRALTLESLGFKFHHSVSRWSWSSLSTCLTCFLTCNLEGPTLPLRNTMRIRDDEFKCLVKGDMQWVPVGVYSFLFSLYNRWHLELCPWP